MTNPAKPLVDQVATAVLEVLQSKGVTIKPPAGGDRAKGEEKPIRKPPEGRPDQETAASMPGEQVAAYIDHTLLKPDATPEQVKALCAEAREHGFASVCVNPSYVSLCRAELAGSGVMVCTVIGFPLGAATTESKAREAREAVGNGADELDMVIHVGRLKARDFHYVCEDIRAVVEAAQGRTVKVIIETSLLNKEQKVAASLLTKAGGAHFVKTSTGFAGGGATVEDIALMRSVVGEGFGVKASGGVRDLEGARKLLAAGANRIGASASIAIVSGGKASTSY